MEPITTTAAISAVVGYLAKKIKSNKSVQSLFEDFTDATVSWIRPLFIKEDGSPEKVLTQLQENPESHARQDAVKSSIAIALEDNPQNLAMLEDMLKIIQTKQAPKGDSYNINQYNSGNGDNIGRDQNNYYIK